MIIPEEPEYMLLWLSNCEWNQLDGKEAGLDLIIGDFGGGISGEFPLDYLL